MNNFIYFMISASECPYDFEVLRVINYIFTILDIVFFVLPIALILIIGFDFFKNVIASKEDDMKKNVSIVIKRIIYCVVMFFIPTIVSFVIAIIQSIGLDNNNYKSYIECAELDVIEKIIISDAEKLIGIAEQELTYSSYNEAKDVVSQIRDDNTRSNYENQLNTIKQQINNDIKDNNPDDDDSYIPSGGNSGSGGGSIDVDYPDAVVENLAAFIASENGWNKEGFFAQLVTGAVYINNYYDLLGKMGVSNKEYTLDNMCKVFSYLNPSGYYTYTPKYCSLTFDVVETYPGRGNIPDEGREQLLIVAKLLLSKTFVPPKHIQFEVNKGELELNNASQWGTASVGAGFPLVYYGYSNYYKPLQGIDVYGNEVSTDFNYYKNLADDLYDKYVK